jgi:hypothetical protein
LIENNVLREVFVPNKSEAPACEQFTILHTNNKELCDFYRSHSFVRLGDLDELGV